MNRKKAFKDFLKYYKDKVEQTKAKDAKRESCASEQQRDMDKGLPTCEINLVEDFL